jgi:phosphoribosylformylglycinamidine cyclo-ligase
VAETSRYKDAGVDIDAGNRLVDRIRPLIRKTHRPEVIGDVGGFGGLFSLGGKYKEPVLVASTDGVGTKLKIAFALGKHDTVGIDLVAMVVNDIIVQGAEPLVFLDYFATGRLEVAVAETVIGGIAEGCHEAGCALIGGETAEMPSMYPDGEYDLAGFGVGVVDKGSIIDGSEVHVGEALVGVASSGLHSNGYSLVRKLLLAEKGYALDRVLPGLDVPLGEELLRPTKIYVRPILNLLREFPIHGLAHITGGGLTENIPRILPDGVTARIDPRSWTRPPIFDLIQREGAIDDAEMRRTFNNGVGMVAIVPEKDADEVMTRLRGQSLDAWVIGDIAKRKKSDSDRVVFV